MNGKWVSVLVAAALLGQGLPQAHAGFSLKKAISSPIPIPIPKPPIPKIPLPKIPIELPKPLGGKPGVTDLIAPGSSIIIKEGKEAVKTGREALSATKEVADGVAHGDFGKVKKGLNKAADTAMTPVRQVYESSTGWAFLGKVLAPVSHRFFLEPEITIVNPFGYRGEIVYYVNGMDTGLDSARIEASWLSLRLQRPVGLIYNRSSGVAMDLVYSVYQRISAANETMPTSADRATRMVAGLLHKAKGHIAIVSHSQGCLIVRNAIVAAERIDGSGVSKQMSWVATGSPMHDAEILIKPAKFRSISKEGDPFANIVGLRSDPRVEVMLAGIKAGRKAKDIGTFADRLVSEAQVAHSFARSYVGQIQVRDID